MSTRTARLALCALILATLTAACFDGNACQSVNPTPVPSPSPSSSPSPSPVADGCRPVYSIAVSVLGHPNPLLVGTRYTLDATPKATDGTSLDPICHGGSVAWTVSGPCVLQGDVAGFNPGLTCSAAGQVTAKACVSAPGGCGSVTVEVRA